MEKNNFNRRDGENSKGVARNAANGGSNGRKQRPRIQRPSRNNDIQPDDATTYHSDYENHDNRGRGNIRKQSNNDPNRFEYSYTDNDNSNRHNVGPNANKKGKEGVRYHGKPLNKKKKKVANDAAKYLRNGYSRAAAEGQPRPQIDALPNRKTYASQGLVRLNRYIANAGICSRRDADKLIQSGAVMVNGEVVTQMGYLVKEGDVVNYGGETLRDEAKRYFLLNKPKGYITTNEDPKDRKTVMELISDACRERIYPVGRLDRNTTGLLLFTNDGELSRKLTHPSTGVYKVYQVELDKPVSFDDMVRMSKGIELEDGVVTVDDVAYANGGVDRRIVGMQLHSGKNRIVRRIFESMGYTVIRLDRTVFAGLTKKDLPRGRYRELTPTEVGYLKMI